VEHEDEPDREGRVDVEAGQQEGDCPIAGDGELLDDTLDSVDKEGEEEFRGGHERTRGGGVLAGGK
jgi:hypothetical protein